MEKTFYFPDFAKKELQPIEKSSRGTILVRQRHKQIVVRIVRMEAVPIRRSRTDKDAGELFVGHVLDTERGGESV